MYNTDEKIQLRQFLLVFKIVKPKRAQAKF